MAQQVSAQRPKQNGNLSEDDWLSDIKRNLFGPPFCPPSSVCIFRVPKFLIDLKEEAYVPQVVSLGPIHWKNRCTPMDDNKLEAVRRTLEGHDIISVVAEIRKLEKEVRECYQEIKCDGETLAWMMTLDGCFLLEIFRTLYEGMASSESSAEEKRHFRPSFIFDGNRFQFLQGYVILNDIMMLQNQIPLFVLTKLLKLVVLNLSEEDAQKLLCKWVYKCLMLKASPFLQYPSDDKKRIKLQEKAEGFMKKSKHLLDFLRLCLEDHLVQASCNLRFSDQADGRPAFAPSAQKLTRAGIEVTAWDNHKNEIRSASKRFRFARKRLSGGTLFIPQFRITDTTEIILRNLMAFEECRASPNNVISRFVFMMNQLIDSEEDVSLLWRHDILDTHLGSRTEVINLFRALCNGITVSYIPQIDEVIGEVVDHYRSRFSVIWREFMEDKQFRNMSIVALVMLVLNIVQTIYTVYSVYKK